MNDAKKIDERPFEELFEELNSIERETNDKKVLKAINRIREIISKF